MLQRNPKGPKELPPTAEVLRTLPTDSELRFLNRWRRNRTLSQAAIGLTLFSGVHAAAYLSDVHHNMELAADAHPSIRVIAEASNELYDDEATVFIHGFNTYDANDLTNKIGPGIQQALPGEQWSVEYNNAVIDANDIAELLVETAEERGIDTLHLMQYSMGDVPGTDAAVKVINETDIDVASFTYLSGPASYESLTQKTQDELAIAENLAWIPWIEYSSGFRYILEAYFYKDAMEKNPLRTIDGINTRFAKTNVTSNLFLASQIKSVSNANVPERLDSINDGELHPVISYVAIPNDKVVNNELSMQLIRDAARKNDFQFNSDEVNVPHAEYFTKNGIAEYDAAFARLAEILPEQLYNARIAYYAMKGYQYAVNEDGEEEIVLIADDYDAKPYSTKSDAKEAEVTEDAEIAKDTEDAGR